MHTTNSTNSGNLACPLCESDRTEPYHRDSKREFFRCQKCFLVFVPPQYFLSQATEKTHYDHHQNDPHDLRYRTFLGRLANPLIEQLRLGSQGLDFGSGPGPTLSLMLSEAGFPTQIYDPIYAPNVNFFNQTYDFITASEVVEHLHRPRFELERLWSLLRPRGMLGIMTKRVTEQAAFENWHYKNDPTHVIFFSESTFRWLSEFLSAELQIIGADVVLLRKN